MSFQVKFQISSPSSDDVNIEYTISELGGEALNDALALSDMIREIMKEYVLRGKKEKEKFYCVNLFDFKSLGAVHKLTLASIIETWTGCTLSQARQNILHMCNSNYASMYVLITDSEAYANKMKVDLEHALPENVVTVTCTERSNMPVFNYFDDIYVPHKSECAVCSSR